MRHELATGLMLTGAAVWAVWIVGMVYGAVASVRDRLHARRLRRPGPPTATAVRHNRPPSGVEHPSVGLSDLDELDEAMRRAMKVREQLPTRLRMVSGGRR